DGRVLLAGGYDTNSLPLQSAEVLTMSSATIVATGISVSNAQNLSGSVTLSGAATGYYDVVVRESGSRAGRLSAGFSVASAPPATPGVTVASISPSSATSGSSLSAALVGTYFDATAAVSLEHDDVTGGTWTFTGALLSTRATPGTVVLGDGRVLIAGGYQPPSASSVLNTVEIYNPVSGTWTAAAPMLTARHAGALVALKDGRVLAAGGRLASNLSTTAAEIYDPSANSWTATASMPTSVYSSPAILLSDGRVLLAGGDNATPTQTQITTAQIYDPSAGTWSTSAMSFAHTTGG